MKIFSGNANKPLADKIALLAQHSKLGSADVTPFPDDGPYCKYHENLRGEDVFLIQPLSSANGKSCNDYLIELLTMVDAARRASADRITAVMPYFPCRQDRKTESRTPICADLWAQCVKASGVDRILTMHLHNPSVEAFFGTGVVVDHLQSTSVFLDYIDSTTSKGTEFVVVSPDMGALKLSQKIAKKLKCGLAVNVKERLSPTKIASTDFIGDVEGKVALIFDDLTETFSTMNSAAKRAKENGASAVITCVSHLINSGFMNNDLLFRHIDKALFTDSCNYKLKGSDKIKQISVASLFASAIVRIHNNESISSLFQIEGW